MPTLWQPQGYLAFCYAGLACVRILLKVQVLVNVSVETHDCIEISENVPVLETPSWSRPTVFSKLLPQTPKPLTVGSSFFGKPGRSPLSNA